MGAQQKDDDHIAWGAESFLKAVTDVAPNLIYVFNHQTMSNEYANRSLGAMLGCSGQEIVHMGSELMTRVIHPADLPCVLANFEAIRALKNHDVTRIEYRARHRDGSWVWLLSTDTVFSRSREGTVTRHLGIAVDITAQKTATAAAIRAEQEAKSANDELRAFAYAVSHDLKAPSNTLGMIVNELQRSLGNRLSKDDFELLSMAEATVARMGHLIEDVLQFTRVIGKEFEFDAVPLETLLDEVSENLHADIVESGAKISRDPMPVVLGNAAQLRILCQNFLANAIKYRKPETAPQIVLMCHETPDGAVLTVKDNGIGIPEDKHEEVFQVFKRLHAHHEIQGQGLGLAICQRVATNHKSRIQLVSQVGQGATFSIKLRVA